MKKNVLVAVIVLISYAAHSQLDNAAFRMANTLDEKARNKSSKFQASRAEGTPYLNKMFTPAVVDGVEQVAMMRYEAYSDQFEFINPAKDTLVLDKDEPFNTITFKLNNTKYKLVEYVTKEEKVKGYLVLLTEKNNFSLYKKQIVKYYKEKFATTSYDTDAPPRFERGNDTFYYRRNETSPVVEFPTSKKSLLKVFPEKKAELEAFIKENRIDFDKEADLIRLANFIAG